VKTLAQQRDKAEIRGRLRTLRPDSVRRWGRMSAHQMICHLSDAFCMGTGEKPVSHATGPLQRTIVKWIALYAPMSWPTGKLLTRPEIDQELLGTRPVDFAADVARVEALVELVTAQPRGFEWQSHPIFGSMSEAAWLRWGYLHMDHHLRQFGA
jgi:hypothetical protein